jgi:uncharacterized protein
VNVRGSSRCVARPLGRVLALTLLAMIRTYQLIVSPMLGQRCRFYPSCSQYALQAIRARGPIVGLGLAGWRLLRCNPWNAGGFDPVPHEHERPAPRVLVAAVSAPAAPTTAVPSTSGMQGA